MNTHFFKPSASSLALLLAMALALVGCHRQKAAEARHDAEVESVELFKEGRGVWFSDETRKLFGLEVVEATEKQMPRRVEGIAQVYRAARDGNPAAASLLLSADEAKNLNDGQPVRLRAAAADGPEIIGKLVRLDSEVHGALGQIEALVEFVDPEQHCAMGTFLTSTISDKQFKPALVVPESALLAAADGCYVYTVNGTHLTRTRVKAGAASDGFVAIEDGLYEGDAVVARGVENLWLVKLSALKGGTPCCPVPKKAVAK
jgi:multidrug efflux pump subunit AcrA (membrane-fusion protein)